MTELQPLYPAIEPYNSGYLKVSDLHTLFYEEVGNPDGIPVVFLHGGPGVGLVPRFRQFFDPDRFHAVLFAQRGANQSLPCGELNENNTWEIKDDIEKLREHLKIERWFVFGGSWGSTLGLIYAIHHPERVMGLVLRGIFLGRQQELDWLYIKGASLVFPEAWERFRSMIPPAERSDLVKAYYQRLTSSDRGTQLTYAKAWCAWEDDIIRLIPKPPVPSEEEKLIAYARIECHFMVNHLFFPRDDYLISELQKIRNIPCWITQGRYDMVCPAMSAYDLSRLLPAAELHLIPDAGHSIYEPGITSSLIEGIEELANRISN
jgi:proline iminopeptidase